MKYLAPIPKQFVDQNGLPLSNGTVHVYISGDTQYANVYQDADGNELMPNPARLDSNGAWVGFVTAGVPLDYVVEDKDGNVQFKYEKVVAGGGDGGGGEGPVYVQESHTSSDSNVTITSKKTTCTFDSNLNDFTGELHVRFQNSGQAATVTFYVNNEYYDKAVSTLSVMTGVTHLMVPVSVKSGRLRAEVTFATASTPSNVKFDLAGYNLGTGGGGSQDASNLTFVSGGSSGGGSVTKTITLPHKYKNAFGGFISFVVKSSSSGLTRTVNWEYTVAGSGISYETGKGQTIVVNYETKVTMPFIVSRDTPFNQITIKFTGTSAGTSIYDADVFFYAEEVVES